MSLVGWAVRQGWAGTLAWVALAVMPRVAFADELVDRGVERYEEADFAGALEMFAQAEQSDGLDRDDLARLYEHRAMVHLALEEEEAMRDDLRRLRALDPERIMGESIPPPMRDAYEEIGRDAGPPLTIRARARNDEGVIRIDASIEGDRAELVRGARVGARPGGARSWEIADGDLELRIRESAPESSRIEYFAEAVGPGGVVLAHDGSRREPRQLDLLPTPADADDDDSQTWLYAGIGAGAVALIAAIVVVSTVPFIAESDQTQLSGPTVTR